MPSTADQLIHRLALLSGAMVLSIALSACTTDYCFVGETLVATPGGGKAIGALRPGDRVLSYDHARGRVVHGIVSQLFSKPARALMRVRLTTGSTMEVTPSHPFYVPERMAYLPIGALREGAVLFDTRAPEQTPTGAALSVIESIKPAGRREVFNLTVEPWHNYFVEGVLVHNKTPLQSRCEPVAQSVEVCLEYQYVRCQTGIAEIDAECLVVAKGAARLKEIAYTEACKSLDFDNAEEDDVALIRDFLENRDCALYEHGSFCGACAEPPEEAQCTALREQLVGCMLSIGCAVEGNHALDTTCVGLESRARGIVDSAWTCHASLPCTFDPSCDCCCRREYGPLQDGGIVDASAVDGGSVDARNEASR